MSDMTAEDIRMTGLALMVLKAVTEDENCQWCLERSAHLLLAGVEAAYPEMATLIPEEINLSEINMAVAEMVLDKFWQSGIFNHIQNAFLHVSANAVRQRRGMEITPKYLN